MRIIGGMSTNEKQSRQWGATFGFYAPRGFTICGKKAEGVFSRWALGNSAHGDTAFPMAASAASATTTKETHGENHELHK